MASYLVTGGTGFLGRFLVQRLLDRGGEVHVLVREGSQDKLRRHAERWGAPDRVHALTGDLTAERLGLSDDDVERLRGVDHVVHAAAVYDLTADEEETRSANVDGTRAVVGLAEELGAGRLHLISSVAVAGEYDGFFREDMFDEGQELPTPYHQTKFESEKVVREECGVPWRVYRPAIVVGDSRTGEMDKIDGPYYFFPIIKRLRDLLPRWVPLVGPELGRTNVVPVDWVADAVDHIAHADGLDGQAFHLAHPKGQRSGEVLNAVMEAAHAPTFALRVDKKLLDALPKGVLGMALKLPALQRIRDDLLRDAGIPPEVIPHLSFRPKFDTRDTEKALRGTDISLPELDDYAQVLWDYFNRSMDPLAHQERTLEAAVRDKVVLITGASSGIGRATALQVAQAGGIPLLVSRGREALEEVQAEIAELGGTAHVHTADLSDDESVAALVDEVLEQHGRVHFVVNNAGRSIRRGLTRSWDRMHDFERTMQLNYFGVLRLMLRLLPRMVEAGGGHVVNVSSIGVQTSPPRFSAYVASKAALDAWTDIASSELLGKDVTFTTIHMPLVKTPMIAPTKIYDAFPTITPDEAASMVTDGLSRRPKHIGTRLGTSGEVLSAVAPKLVDQVLHLAYQVMPENTSSKKREDGGDDEDGGKPDAMAVAMANALKGVHW